MKKRDPNHWLTKIEELESGEPCEFRYPAARDWFPGTVVQNGGPYYWHVRNERGEVIRCLYIEHIRLPGQTEAWSRR